MGTSDGSSRSVPARYWIGLVLLVALGLVPLVTTQTQLVAVESILYLMMFAMTWDVASGYTGQLNFGHAFFIAVGGYTTAILNISHGVSPLLSIPVAVVVSAVAGLVVGVPALRLRGAYLALVTLVAPAIFYQIVILFDGVFKGSFGFKTPPTGLAGLASSSTGSIVTVHNYVIALIIDYYISYAALVVLFALLFAYTRSDAGKILTAIREDEEALVASGIDPAKHKVFSFMISAATAGFAGALYIHSATGFPHPSKLLPTTLSLNVIIVSVIGGLGTIIGALVGALIFGGVEFIAGELSITILGQQISDVVPIFLFVLGMVVVYYRPDGLVPYVLEVGKHRWDRFNGRTETPQPAPDGGETPLEQTAENYREELDDLDNCNDEH